MKSKNEKVEKNTDPKSVPERIPDHNTYEADEEYALEYFNADVGYRLWNKSLLIGVPLIVGMNKCVNAVHQETKHPQCKVCAFGYKLGDVNFNPACHDVLKYRRTQPCPNKK